METGVEWRNVLIVQSSKVKIITGNFIVIIIMLLMTMSACAEMITLGHYNHHLNISHISQVSH